MTCPALVSPSRKRSAQSRNSRIQQKRPPTTCLFLQSTIGEASPSNFVNNFACITTLFDTNGNAFPKMEYGAYCD